MKSLIVRTAGPLKGSIAVPGDKSISHRALICGALADGITRIKGLAASEDVQHTRKVLGALGTRIRDEKGEVVVEGRGGVFEEPKEVLYCGNSGTTMRLMIGVLATQPFTTCLTGDASLNRRPMERVMGPLRAMGAQFKIENHPERGRLLFVTGRRGLKGINYLLPVASAQVKTAILLAGLSSSGETAVSDSADSRDHTERMLRLFGGDCRERGLTVSLRPSVLKAPREAFHVPGDFSSAAFLIAAGLIVPGSQLILRGVNTNVTRSRMLTVLERWRASVSVSNEQRREDDTREPYGDIVIGHGALTAAEVGIDGIWIPQLIDEIPVIGMLGAFAGGHLKVRDAAELRVKESDRIETLAQELRRMGAKVTTCPDGFDVAGGAPLHPAAFESHGDHRIAMSCVIAGLGLPGGPSRVGDTACIATSFPEFVLILRKLGGKIEEI